jgi:hypothetical protein
MKKTTTTTTKETNRKTNTNQNKIRTEHGTNKIKYGTKQTGRTKSKIKN